MSSTSTVISFAESTLPTCNPNLMPFHIGYSGPASVSAFMRVESYKEHIAEETVTVPFGTNPDVEMEVDATTMNTPPSDTRLKHTLSTASSSTEVESQVASETTVAGESPASSLSSSEATQTATAELSSMLPELEDADRRIVSTFRGRAIHGITIDLPSGYSGLVLRGEESSKTTAERIEAKKKDEPKSKAPKSNGKVKAVAKEKPTAKPRGRLTRSAVAKPAVITVEDEDEEMEENVAEPSANDIDNDQPETLEDALELPDQPDVRKLVPQAQFSSFTLWHADRPVDKGNDDYYRALTEWISLSHEINRTDL